MRHTYDPFAANDGAGAMNSPSLHEMLETIAAITARTWEVTEDSGKKALAEAEVKSRADEWASEAALAGGRSSTKSMAPAHRLSAPISTRHQALDRLDSPDVHARGRARRETRDGGRPLDH